MKMKRFLGILLSLTLMLGLVPGLSLTAYAAPTETLLTTITGTGSNTSPATSANVSYSTEGVATLTFSPPTDNGQVSYQASPAWGWWGNDITLTVTPAEGYTITKCIFYDDANRTATDSEAPFIVETAWDDKTPKVNGAVINYSSKGITKIDVYGYATPTHTHSFSYSADGATITATCANTDGNCTLPPSTQGGTDHAVKLTVSAVGAAYTRSAYTGASLSNTTAWTGAGLTAPTIEYAGRGTTSYTKSTTAPINAGTYTASITVDTDKTATADFTINPMALTITGATATNRTYDKDSTAVTISAVTFKDSSSNPVALTLTTDYTVTGAMTDANAGDNKEVTATVTLSNGNYSLATNTATTTVNIGKAGAQTIADVTDTLLYTATSVSESVAGKMPSDAGTLSYSAGTASKTGSVTVSDFTVNATSGTVTATLSGGAVGDTVTLPVTIGSTNYTDSTVNVKITLTAKGIQTITADDVTVSYGDTGKSVSASVTDPATGGGAISYAVKTGCEDYIGVDVTTGALTIKKVPADGKAYVTVTAAGTATYEQATKDVTVTINKADPTVTAPTAKTLTYTGSAQELVNAGSTNDGELRYAVTTENTAPTDDNLYTASIPAKTEAGTYYVWYKVVGDENHNDSEPDCVTSTIKKKSAPVSVYYELILSTTEGASGEPTSSVRSPILAGTSVTVTAADPAEGCRFAGWFLGDVCVSEEQVYTFVMRSYTKLQARYEADSKDGLVLDPDGVWRVYEDNVFREDYIGLYEYDGGLFFIANGELCADANGLNLNGADGKWYFLANGQVQTRHSGFAEYDGSWFMIEKGMLDENANGLYEYDGGVFAFAAGRLRTDINGLWLNPLDNRWYFLANGQVQTQHTGVAGYDGAFFVIADGELDSDYNGRIWYDGALFNVVCGQLYGPVEEESYAGEGDSFEAAEAVEYADEESFEGTETAYAENDEEEPEREEAVVDEAEESADIVVENPAEAESAA